MQHVVVVVDFLVIIGVYWRRVYRRLSFIMFGLQSSLCFFHGGTLGTGGVQPRSAILPHHHRYKKIYIFLAWSGLLSGLLAVRRNGRPPSAA